MKNIFNKYSLRLIKENSYQYDSENNISNPEMAGKILNDFVGLNELPEEHCYIIALDVKNKVIGLSEIAFGGISCAVIDVKNIAKRLLLMNANSFIVAHNHPSGNTDPSKDDILTAEKLSDMGKVLNLEMLDFLIISYEEVVSFKQKYII